MTEVIPSYASDARPCPVCGSMDAVPIVYGLPGIDLWEAAQRGELVLGGCIVDPESPEFECGSCHAPLPWAGTRANLSWQRDDLADDERGSAALDRVGDRRR